MSNAVKLAAAFGLAVLASSTTSFAQEHLRQTRAEAYVSGTYDCYYDISPGCDAPAAYIQSAPDAYAQVVPAPVDAFAAIGGVVQPPYPVTTRPRSLRGEDLVAIHGSGG